MIEQFITWLMSILVRIFSRRLHAPCRLRCDGGKDARKSIGRYGESVAADWLRGQCCRILARNFRAPRGGEVDIIARQGRLLMFIEVKTRHSSAKIRPFEAVDAKKRCLIERGANAWLKRLGTRNLPWRFDVIEVHYDSRDPPRINHIRDAF
jgi:putative endonuclease